MIVIRFDIYGQITEGDIYESNSSTSGYGYWVYRK